nr:Chain C, Vif GW10 peptide from Virion infectivity factor [Simian immunodeficiency virus]
GSHLEVQGYW